MAATVKAYQQIIAHDKHYWHVNYTAVYFDEPKKITTEMEINGTVTVTTIYGEVAGFYSAPCRRALMALARTLGLLIDCSHITVMPAIPKTKPKAKSFW